MKKNSKEDWSKTLEEGTELMKAFVEAERKYSEWCIKTFGKKDGQPFNLIELANMIRQVK